jgi:hypothetical protein
MDSYKRREIDFERLLANKPELDRHSSKGVNNRINPEIPV